MKILVTVITYLLMVSFIYVNCVESTTGKYDYLRTVHIEPISLKNIKFPCYNDTRCIEVFNDSICHNHFCLCRAAPNKQSKPYYCGLDKVDLTPKKFSVVGRICKHDEDCVSDNFFCNTTRHQCFCIPGYTADTGRHNCLPIVKNITGACEDNEQCLVGIPNSICYNKTCVCSDGYHLVGNECWKTAGYLEPCSEDNECYFGVKSDPKGAKCINNVCNCTVNYIYQDNTCSGAYILNSLSVIAIILLSISIFICT